VLSIQPVGWDSTRPVPWQRLLREYAIYAGIMAVVLLVITRGKDVAPLLAGLVFAAPIYFGLGAVMAKFGYQRKTLRELRTPRADASDSSGASGSATAGDTERARPAPTRRTSTGPNRPQRPRRKR